MEHLIVIKILVAHKIITLGTGARQFGFFLDNLTLSEKCPPRNSAIYTQKFVNKSMSLAAIFWWTESVENFKLTDKQNIQIIYEPISKFLGLYIIILIVLEKGVSNLDGLYA